MTHTKGLNRNTRSKFAQPFKYHGAIRMKNYLTKYRIGDYVDVKVNGSQQKGMPHRFYHGRTGRVFNINPRGVGVEVNKPVGNRIIQKRIHVRVEHIKKSNCREGFLARIRANDALKAAANKEGKRISTKRQPGKPREAFKAEGAVLHQNPSVYREVF